MLAISKELKKQLKKESGQAYLEKRLLEKRGEAFILVAEFKDRVQMEKLLSADYLSEFEEMFNSLECQS